MSDSYQAAGWTPFAIFAVAAAGAVALRITAENQTTRLRLLLMLIVLGVTLPYYGFEALPGLGGTNVVSGHVVNWARYTVNSIRVPAFAAMISLSLDPLASKAFALACLGLGMSLPLIFGTESANQGVWFFFIWSGISALLYAIYAVWFLQVPPDRLQFVSNWKSWFVKLFSILGFWVYVFVGYVIDTAWTDATTDLALLQWLNAGWDVIFYVIFGLYVLGWVDLFEDSKTLSGMHIGPGSGGLPYMAPTCPPGQTNGTGAPDGYTAVPAATSSASRYGNLPATNSLANQLRMP